MSDDAHKALTVFGIFYSWVMIACLFYRLGHLHGKYPRSKP